MIYCLKSFSQVQICHLLTSPSLPLPVVCRWALVQLIMTGEYWKTSNPAVSLSPRFINPISTELCPTCVSSEAPAEDSAAPPRPAPPRPRPLPRRTSSSPSNRQITVEEQGRPRSVDNLALYLGLFCLRIVCCSIDPVHSALEDFKSIVLCIHLGSYFKIT